MNGMDLCMGFWWVCDWHRKERMTNDSYIHDAPAHTEEPGYVFHKFISFKTLASRQTSRNLSVIRRGKRNKMRLPVLSGRDTVDILKCSGEMQLVVVTDLLGNFSNGQPGFLQ